MIPKDVAVLLKHDDIIPLKCLRGGGPTLYLDGSNAHTTPQRSDFCLAWCIRPLPPPQAKARAKHNKDTAQAPNMVQTHSLHHKEVTAILP